MFTTARVVESVTISCSIQDVFDFVSDFQNDKRWWSGVIEARQISQETAGKGTRYLQVVRLFGQTFEVGVEVTEYSAPHYLAISNQQGMTPFTATYALEPVAEGTRFTMDAQVSPQGIFKVLQPLFVPLLRYQTRTNFQKLKQVMEATCIQH